MRSRSVGDVIFCQVLRRLLFIPFVIATCMHENTELLLPYLGGGHRGFLHGKHLSLP